MLGYVSGYHLHCSLSLESGRTIVLRSLAQEWTYDGLLLGTPFALFNGQILESAVKDAEKLVYGRVRVWLVDPPRRDYFREPGDMKHSARKNLDWIPEWLPLVRCIGVFNSLEPARDKNAHYSELTIVWFQDEYAPPILAPALSSIRAVRWNSFATDLEYT
jgi:hypothetical protein